MNKIERYKKLYPSPNKIEELVLHENGKVDIPKWLIIMLLHSTGLKSRKKRIVKKRIKRELHKILQSMVE